jgi:hypothetical protein
MCLGEGEELSGDAESAGAQKSATRSADMHLLYYGRDRIHVRGPVTGKLYQFSRQEPLQAVDPRDAVSILKTRLFRRIR